ncbi:unnamed protein product [Schistocephalus solidus]|uniref:HORMA domain-containing protein n=1 Tax=Schistocephalus solidus TaxID=70667 RepID=A0A183TKA1_SCHSO|nr:unnamed protein product [Schistocephalus solidus]
MDLNGFKLASGRWLTDRDYDDDITSSASSFDNLRYVVSRLNEVIYLFSESINDDVLLVVELLTDDGNVEHILGWSFFRLLKLVDAGSAEEDFDTGYVEMVILKGTPRSLFLMAAFDEDKGLKFGQCDPEIETEVDRMKVIIQGTELSTFEKELSKCIQLRSMTSTQLKTNITVVDWFLKIFVHTGWRTVEPVQSVLLEIDKETANEKMSRSSRAAPITQLAVKNIDALAGASVLSASTKVLLEMPRSENVAVVFILQCVLAEVNENVSQAVDSEISAPTSTWNIRFGHILPLQSPEFAAGQEATFKVDLRGSGKPEVSDKMLPISRRYNNPAAGDTDPTVTMSMAPDLKNPAGDAEEDTEAANVCPDAARCLSQLAPFEAQFRLSCTIRPSAAEAQVIHRSGVCYRDLRVQGDQ